MLNNVKIPILSFVLVVLVTLLPTGCKTIEPPPPAPIEVPPPEPEPTPAPEPTPEPVAEESAEPEITEETDAEIFDPEALQQQALDLCQSATEFLDQGDVDDALVVLFVDVDVDDFFRREFEFVELWLCGRTGF